MAKSNSTVCFKDLIVLRNIGTELTLLYMTAGCNVLLLVLNITILWAVLGYMKPTISEIRRQTFIIMDNILLSYIPSRIRECVGCKSEVRKGENTKQSTRKGTKGTNKTTTSRTSTNTTKTGGTAAASE